MKSMKYVGSHEITKGATMKKKLNMNLQFFAEIL